MATKSWLTGAVRQKRMGSIEKNGIGAQRKARGDSSGGLDMDLEAEAGELS